MPDFSQKPPPKRSLIIQQPQMGATIMDPKPHLGQLLEDALTIYQTEILKLKKKSNQIGTLSASEATVLQGYVKSLVNAAKEVRETEKEAEAQASNLSDAELLEALESEMKAVRSRLRPAK